MQVCSRDEVYDRPDNAFVATVVGEMNALDCRITASADGFAQVDTPLGAVQPPIRRGCGRARRRSCSCAPKGCACWRRARRPRPDPVPFPESGSGVFIAMVYAYILLVVFPLYNVLETLDMNQVEATRDLGASTWNLHRRVVIPHARPGIAVGCVMTFMLSAGSYAVPHIMTRGTASS